jgi:hypothetical protein
MKLGRSFVVVWTIVVFTIVGFAAGQAYTYSRNVCYYR